MRKILLVLFIIIFSHSLTCFGQSTNKSNILVYSTIQPSYWEIYLFEKEKSRALTSGASLNYNPIFSPDGKWLVFTSEKTGTGFLYALNLNHLNSKPKRLTVGNSFEDAAAFSPDGKTLYLMSTRDGTSNIFKMPFQPEKLINQSEMINLTKNNSSNFNPAVSPDGQWVAFSSNRDAPPVLVTNPQPPINYRSTNIYLMKTDGSQLKKITHGSNWEGSPAWSADGKQIYFYAIKDNATQIYKMQQDGTNMQAITPPNISAYSPAIMPNGRVAFTAIDQNKIFIASVKSDGSDYRLETDKKRDYFAPAYDLTNNRFVAYGQAEMPKDIFYAEVPGGKYMNKPMGVGPFFVNRHALILDNQKMKTFAVRGYFPNYLPKEKKVASVKEFTKIVLSNLDGTDMKEIFHADQNYMIGLTVSPDHKWFVTAIGMPFAGTKAVANICKVASNGEQEINLTDTLKSNNTFPRFTSDGKHIIFRSSLSGNKNIYIMDSNGSNIKQLTFDKTLDTMPAISPMGDKIAFSSVRGGENYRIYLLELKPNGNPGRLTKLTNGPGADVHPFFSPDGKWIAYASERAGLKDETPLIPIFSPQPYGEVYLIRLSDKKIVPITDNKWEDSLPYWAIE